MATLPNIAEALRQADESFAATGDPMEALSWIAFAAKSGNPIPPRIGEWLHAAVGAYERRDAASMDAALGLKVPGKWGQPRARKQARSRLDGLLSEMLLWVAHGANIEEAAYLVSLKAPDYKEATLADRFKRSKMKLGGKARELRTQIKRESNNALWSARVTGKAFDPIGFVSAALETLPREDWRAQQIAKKLRNMYGKTAL